MARPSIVPDILRRLEPYLEEKLADYWAKDDPREPTLPCTSDRKINVRAVTLAIGLKLSQEQHFYKHAALTSTLNVAAEAQGLSSIGSRAQMNTEDAAARKQISRAQTEASDYAKALAEREAVIQRQRTRIAQLEEMLRIRDETGMVIRTEPIW